MAAPTRPKKKAEVKKATSARAWKDSKPMTDVAVPSGNVARVRMLGPQAFLDTGKIPNILLPLVQEAIDSKKGLKPKDTQDMMEDPAMVTAALEMLDFILVKACVEPEVQSLPAEGEERDPELLYVDEVDLNDKVFIVNFVLGGTKNLESFREEYGAVVGSVAAE